MTIDMSEGFNDLVMELEDLLAKTIDVQSVLEVGAKEYARDLSMLGKPYSEIKKSGYTHMLDSISYRRSGTDEVEVGSTKSYHLRFVNDGTKGSSKRPWSTPRQPFLNTTYEQNKNKYNKKMLRKLGLER